MSAEMYEIVADAAERSENWLEERRKMITASDVATILGQNHRKDAYTLWAEKVGLVEPDEVTASIAEMGLLSEPMNLEWYRKRTGRNARLYQKLARSTRYPWLGATCDAWVQYEGTTIPLELKLAHHTKEEDWSERTPDYYLPQPYTQALVMGTEMFPICASVSVVVNYDQHWEDLERDPKIIERILDETRDFHRRILKEDPPPVTEKSHGALAKQYPDANEDETITLSDGLLDDTMNIDMWTRERDSYDKLIKDAKARIKAAMGEAKYAVAPGFGGWSYGVTERKQYAKAEVIGVTKSRTLRRTKEKR